MIIDGPRQGWERVVIAATGPSFDRRQADAIRARRRRGDIRVIAVSNNAIPNGDTPAMLPDADAMYACDLKWWKLHGDTVRATFAGEKWTQDWRSAQAFGLEFVRLIWADGLTKQRGVIHGGGNSGYQAVNLAYLFGAKTIVLAGFDCQLGEAKERHNFGSHPKELSQSMPFNIWIERFAVLAKDLRDVGVEVLNATARTALECFPRVSLDDALGFDGAFA